MDSTTVAESTPDVSFDTAEDILERTEFDILTTSGVAQAEAVGNEDIDKLLEELTTSPNNRENYTALKGVEASRLLNSLQLWVDQNPKHVSRRKAIRLLIDLASQSGKLPQSLFIVGVNIGEHRDPYRSGGFSDVFRGIYREKKVAVKRLKIQDRGEARAIVHRMLCTEGLVWRQLDHPNILQFIGIDGQTFRETTTLAMVSPWMTRGTIMEFIRSSSYNVSEDRQRLLREVATGLEYLHDQKISHGDLHSGNIFVAEDGRACLADFGVTVVGDLSITDQRSSSNLIGKTRWMGPELLLSDEVPRKTASSDVFAFGRLCLAICTKREPFYSFTNNQVIFKVSLHKNPDRPNDDICFGCPMSDDLWNLAEDCWTTEPADRPKMRDILRRLSGTTT